MSSETHMSSRPYPPSPGVTHFCCRRAPSPSGRRHPPGTAQLLRTARRFRLRARRRTCARRKEARTHPWQVGWVGKCIWVCARRGRSGAWGRAVSSSPAHGQHTSPEGDICSRRPRTHAGGRGGVRRGSTGAPPTQAPPHTCTHALRAAPSRSASRQAASLPLSSQAAALHPASAISSTSHWLRTAGAGDAMARRHLRSTTTVLLSYWCK